MKLVAAAILLFASSTHAAGLVDRRLIEVSAIAERGIDPDLLEMNVEVWSKAATANQAQSLGGLELKKVQTIFDRFKLDKKDIQTESFNFGPEYVWDQKTNQNRLAGFRSTQTLHVTLRKTEEAGKFLDALTAGAQSADEKRAMSGVNVNSIQWDSSKRSETEIAGLADAVKIARKRADELAKAAGVKIAGVYNLSHSAGVERVEAPQFAKAASRLSVAADAGGGTELSGGQIKVRVSVGAQFMIE